MKKVFKNLFFISLFIVINTINTFSYNLCGEDIWMGGINNQYGNMSYGAVADYEQSDEKLQVKGYGRYQFYYKTNLVDFLTFLDSNYFNKWINFGQGSDKLNEFTYGLQINFTDYFNDKKDLMIEKQDEYIYTNYYLVAKDMLSSKGLNLDNYSQYVKGAVFSYVMYNIEQNEVLQTPNETIINKIVSFVDEDEEKFITNLYNYLIEINTNNKDLFERFSKEKRACIEQQDDTLESKLGETLNSKGTSESFTLIRDINNANNNIFRGFLQDGKFGVVNEEWYYSIRKAGEQTDKAFFKNEFGIQSGTLDFGIETSKGFNKDSYIDMIQNELCFTTPDSSGVYYIPQNYTPKITGTNQTTKEVIYENGKDYGYKPFGSNNIAQSGGSLACMSMAFNKLLSRNSGNLILPNNIADKIAENNNENYNAFYDENKKGQDISILSEVAGYYGLSATQVSGNSIGSICGNGGLVIARVKESEFTKYGNFVLIVNSENKNGKTMLTIYDPNINHANYIYKLYDVDYLINDCGGIFYKISM